MIARWLIACAMIPALGCAMAATPLPHAPDPALAYGARAQRTAFEGGAEAPAPAPVGPAPAAKPADVGDDDPAKVAKQQRARTTAFWAGIATTALGGAMLTSFGIAGRVTQSQIDKGYDDGSLTYAREDQLRDRGKAFNAVAAAGAGVTVIGAAIATIVYGVDYARCGTLAKRRKDCKR